MTARCRNEDDQYYIWNSSGLTLFIISFHISSSYVNTFYIVLTPTISCPDLSWSKDFILHHFKSCILIGFLGGESEIELFSFLKLTFTLILPTLYWQVFVVFFFFVATDTSKCEIRKQGGCKDYISRLYNSLDQLIFTSRAKRKLAMFEFFTNTQSYQCLHHCHLCISIYLVFSSVFTAINVSKCKIKN